MKRERVRVFREPRHLPAQLAILYITFATNGEHTLTTNRLRVWAHRHPGISAGRAPDNTALYDVEAILRHINKRTVAKRIPSV